MDSADCTLSSQETRKISKCRLMPPSYATYQEACGKYTNLSKYLDICVYVTHVYPGIIFLIEHNLGDAVRKAG